MEEKNGLDLSEFEFKPPEMSEWTCYMFGNTAGGYGIVFKPQKGCEPNRFVRWMMKVCFACTWIKEE